MAVSKIERLQRDVIYAVARVEPEGISVALEQCDRARIREQFAVAVAAALDVSIEKTLLWLDVGRMTS